MVEANALPPYLTTSSALIKALKSSQEPPGPGWPDKIEIARQSWEREDFVLYRKDAVLQEWITEEFLKIRGSRGSTFNPLVDYRYHHLLGQLCLTESSSKSSTFPLQAIVHNFFATLRSLGNKIEGLERLMQAASTTFQGLFRAAHEDASAVAGKAEAWLETFTLMMMWIAKEDMTDCISYVEPLLVAIGLELVVSLDVAQNRKKVTLSLPSLLPSMLSVWHQYPPLRGALDPSTKALLFSLPVLQTEDMSAGYLLPVIAFHSEISSATKLEFVPHYLSLLVKSLQQNRYTLFPPTGSSRNAVPLDVHVSDRVRQAVLLCTEIVLDTVDKISSPTADVTARCSSKTHIWQAIKDWGGYLEGDRAWSTLLQKTLTGVTRSPQSSEELLLGSIIELLNVLVGLDYPACQLTVLDGNECARSSRTVFSQALLACSGQNYSKAQTLLLSITRHHALTHDTPELLNTLFGCLREALQMGPPRDAYRRIASGPIVSLRFRQSLSRSISEMLAGGAGLDGGWAASMNNLARRLSECVTPVTHVTSDAEGPRKKRRVNDGSSAAPSVADASVAEYGILARFAVLMLDTAIEESYENVSYLKPVIAEHSILWDTLQSLQLGTSWAQGVFSAGTTRLFRSTLRYKCVEASEDTISASSSIEDASSNGERLYQCCLAALETAEKNGTFASDAEYALKIMFNVPGGGKSWSGIDAELDETNISVALWQALAVQSLPVIEAYAADKYVDLLARNLMGAAVRFVSSGDLSITTASHRVLSSTTVWELSRLQESIASLIKDCLLRAESTHEDMVKVYSLLMIAPADYLNRPLRNLSMSKAYEWDLLLLAQQETAQTSVLSKRYLSKIISETGYLGSLETANIDSFLKTSSRPLVGHLKPDASTDLLGQILRVLLRDPKNEKNSGALSYLTGKLVNDLPKHPELGATCAILLTSLSDMEMSFDILPSHILANLDELHRKLVKIVQKQDKGGDINPLVLFLHRASVIYSSWRNIGQAASLNKDDTLPVRAIKLSIQRLASGKMPAATVLADVALPALDILAVETRIDTQEESALLWMGYWLAINEAASQAGTRLPAVLNPLFQRSMARVAPNVFGFVLTSLLDRMGSIPAETFIKIESTLEALSLLLTLQVPNSGKVFKQSLSKVLASLHLVLAGSFQTEVKVQALRILESISERKPVSLSEQDASEIVLSSFAALSPAMNERDPRTNPEPLILVLSICNSLVRHRRDLILNILPHLMKLYARVFGLFSRPRTVTGLGKLRSIIINRRPTWLGPQDEDCLDANCAAAVARAISTLTGRTTIRRGKGDDGSKLRSSGMERDLGSLVGQLSKHAPGVLVAYTKAVADPLAGLPVGIRREMEPGLFALCEAITAGGKAQYGKGPGEGVGEAFGLGEGENSDAEFEVWVDLWQRWSSKRYSGQG